VKILLLEDNKRLNSTIERRLKLEGYEVDTFVDGEKANDAIGGGYSCFVLDINVPSLNGVEILKNIREYFPNVPIIIISSTVELEIIKDAYALGCDDYLKKPFYIDELIIKIKKLCNVEKNIVKIGENYLFDTKENTLYADGKIVELSKKEELLLELFINYADKLVTYERIQSFVWEGSLTTVDSIRTLVKRLRKKLPEGCIKTEINKGYRFLSYGCHEDLLK